MIRPAQFSHLALGDVGRTPSNATLRFPVLSQLRTCLYKCKHHTNVTLHPAPPPPPPQETGTTSAAGASVAYVPTVFWVQCGCKL